ncbi:50S ribosomal protein L21 [Candidatus Gottesmanbacteria bacterium]|nr:50S ribosomal protein L21 [Candidatus Gottesmanbacteria bacterium]
MQYAIFASGGKQYKVSVGEEVLVDKLDAEKDKPYTFEKVLLVRDNDDVMLGNPYLANVLVLGKVLDAVKGKKIHIYKYKAKVHYRRKMGFRPLYSKVKIESISIKGKVSATKSVQKKTSGKS